MALILALGALALCVCAMRHSFTNRKALRLILAEKPAEAQRVLDEAFDGYQGYDV